LKEIDAYKNQFEQLGVYCFEIMIEVYAAGLEVVDLQR